jgi:hypothetical protein
VPPAPPAIATTAWNSAPQLAGELGVHAEGLVAALAVGHRAQQATDLAGRL